MIHSPRRFLNTIGFPYPKAALIIVLQMVTTVFEGAGVATLIPLFELTAAGGDPGSMVDQSRLWQMTTRIFDALHLPLSTYSLMAALFLIVVCRQALKAITQIYYSSVQNRCIRDARILGFSAAMNACVEYHDKNATGDIVNDLLTDLERALGAIFGIVFSIGSILLIAAYGGIVAMVTSWSVIGLIGMILFFALVLRKIFRRSLQNSEAIARLNRNLSTFLFERLTSVRLVLLSSSQVGERHSLSAIASELCDLRINLVKLAMRIPLIVEPLAFVVVMSVMVVSTTTFEMKFEVTIIILGLLVRLLPVVQELATTGQGILSSWGSVVSVDKRLDSLEKAREHQGGMGKFPNLDTGIEVEHVSYQYDDTSRSSALEDVSILFEAGKLTAIVGPSGAGKSTLIDLLTRLRIPKSGDILIDRASISEISLGELRGKIAFVPQDPQVFDHTIKEHIMYGNPEATDDAIRAAAAMTGAAEFIDTLPDGYNTRVGDSAVLLSGGQKQRLDLARAVVRDAPILILDEPASGLDAHSEAILRDAILRIRDETGATIILIAHGFSLVVDADKIVVLDAGKVAGIGTHTSLLGGNKWYASAYSKQFHGLQERTENPSLV
jgi:ABC-type multidrug transport system fused ATPase/permease subunit